MNQVSSILREATRDKLDRLNVITAPTHETYSTNMSWVNADFYMFQHPTFKKWNNAFRGMPPNYRLLDERLELKQLPQYIDYDVVLSQNKFGQYDILSQIAKHYGLPLISLEHTLPMAEWPPIQMQKMKSMQGDINLFISEYSKNKWGFDDVPNTHVIHHGVDSATFCPGNKERLPRILSVVNDWINRDWCCGFSIWQRVTQGLPVFPVGDTKGLSRQSNSVEELVDFYQTSQIFINTSTVSPIPCALLEGMSSGCACVSTATCMIPEIIQHGYNGFITNDEKEMRGYLELLLSDEKLRNELGQNARKTIVEKFSLEKFTENWDNFLRMVIK